MSILNRISTILRANINDLLDRAEDPELALNQYVRDVADAINEARTQVFEATAQEKLTESDLQQAQGLVAQWQHRAELAVAQGSDDLARESLRRKRDYERNVQVYQQQLAAQQKVATRLQADLQALESKYAEAERDRDLMIARYRGAQAQEAIQQNLAAISINDPTNALARMDDRIRTAEARAAAASELGAGSLEGRLASLDDAGSDLDIESELRDLKARHQVSGPAPSSGGGPTQGNAPTPG